MKLNDISQPLSAARLNENLANKFGQRIKLEDFTLEQLENVRNKLRTKLSQIETNESFDAIHTEDYQKQKMFLDVVNAAIKEMAEEEVDETSCDEPEDDADESLKFHKKRKFGKARRKYHGEENMAETKINEGEEDKAEIIMAAKDMVDRLTSWMEDTAEMQTESMLDLADAIRDELGAEQSESFSGQVKPALDALYQEMEITRKVLTQGVGLLTGEGEDPMMMGADDPGMEDEMEPTVDDDLGGVDDLEVDGTDDLDVDDEFASSGAAAGGPELAGRAKRESRNLERRNMIESSRRLASLLGSKKK